MTASVTPSTASVVTGSCYPAPMSDTVIVGAGITGLSLARRLARNGGASLVLEATDRAGGPIRTHRTGGLMLEMGPQSLRSVPHTLELIDDLQLQDRIIPVSDAAKRRFILWEGKLREMPQGLLDRSFMHKRDLLRVLREPFVERRTAASDESIHAFISRRFGPKIAERLVDAMVAGIYAGDPDRLEIAATFPDLVEWESKGSVLAGAIKAGLRRPKRPSWAPASPFTLKNGLSSLVDTLAGSLPQGTLQLSCAVERIERVGKGYRVHAPGGPYDAERVVVTAPPGHAASFLPELADELAAMPSALVAAVHLAFKSSEAPSPEGFGWLSAASQRKDVLGSLWVSSTFPSFTPGRTVIRLMIGGSREDVTDLTDEQLVLRARKVVAEVERITADPVLTYVNRAHLPQYETGHTARMKRLRAATPGLDLVGWGYTGLGIEGCAKAAAAVAI